MIVPVFLAILAVAIARPQQHEREPVPILEQEVHHDLDGGYNFRFATGDGVSRSEEAIVKNPGTPDEAAVVRGTFTYTDENGQTIVTTFIADENGYQAEGDHLPIAPPVPEDIAKATIHNLEQEAKLSDQEREAVASGRYIIQ